MEKKKDATTILGFQVQGPPEVRGVAAVPGSNPDRDGVMKAPQVQDDLHWSSFGFGKVSSHTPKKTI